MEKKLDDLIKNKKEDVKKNDETAENNVEDPSKPDNDDTNFPPLRKSFSTKVNKSKGKVIQSDPSLFTNPNTIYNSLSCLISKPFRNFT